jgi:hypothetical protein
MRILGKSNGDCFTFVACGVARTVDSSALLRNDYARTENGKNNRRSFDCVARKGAIHFAQDDNSFAMVKVPGNWVAKAKAQQCNSNSNATATAMQQQQQCNSNSNATAMHLQVQMQQRNTGSLASL